MSEGSEFDAVDRWITRRPRPELELGECGEGKFP